MMRCLAVCLLLLPGAGLTAAEVVSHRGTVEEVKGDQITLQEGAVYAVGLRTTYVRKTADGEAEAKLADLKEGTRVEIQMEKGARAARKVIILKAPKAQ